jgi:hypothetical protein
MTHVGERAGWRAVAGDLGRAMAAHGRPVTWVLGAGASITSGAPSTGRVHAALERATKGRFDGRVRERLHELRRQEVQDALEPLFARVVPELGYRLLGAMARYRRVNLLTLNWDPAARMACERARVPFSAVDPIRSRLTVEQAEARLPPGSGMLIVHVHGQLGDDARYGVLETLPDQPPLLAAVERLLSHDTVICGASLAVDLDVAYMLRRLAAQVSRDGAAVWLFSRRGGMAPDVAIPSHWYRVTGGDVDFDAIVCTVAQEALHAAGVQQARWEDLRRARLDLELPAEDELIELAPSLRRRALDAPVVALVGPPRSGKTVSAVRLAHLRRLVESHEAPPRITQDPQDAAAELGLARAGLPVTLALDDPFGSTDPMTNPPVIEGLSALCGPDGARAIVTSRLGNWGEQPDIATLEDEPEIFVLPADPAVWWRKEDLLRVAAQGPASAEALVALHDGAVQTPPQLIDLRAGESMRAGDVVADKCRLLQAQPQLAIMAMAVRLQELRSSPVREAELSAMLAGADPNEVDRHGAITSSYVSDERRHWRLNHPTSREAVDAWMLGSADELSGIVGSLPVAPMWLLRAVQAWRLSRGVSHEAAVAGTAVEVEPADWFAARLGVSPDAELLEELIDYRPDTWAGIEMAYEIVRVWRSIRREPRARELLERIGQWPLGDYALLEGCLYLGHGADPELWAHVGARLYALAADEARWFELVLALDAVMWRPPTDQALAQFGRRALAELDPDSDAFGLIRFAAGYHPEGLASLEPEEMLAIDARRGMTVGQAACAARLVAFHYAHQSRARAMLHRSGHVEKQWLCQTLHPQSADSAPAGAMRLLESLAEHPHCAGWAFHLSCNLAAITPFDLRDGAGRRAALSAFQSAPTGDAGIVSAVLAYDTADSMASALRQRFAAPEERDALMDGLARGVDALGHTVGPPRFRYILDPVRVLRVCGVPTGALDPQLPRDPEQLAAGLWNAYATVVADDPGRQRQALEIIGRVERGDLRPLMQAARGASGDAFERALATALAVGSPPEGQLFP